MALYDLRSDRRLLEPSYRRWCMTERSEKVVERSQSHFQIGPSQVRWLNDQLHIDIQEISLPWAQSVKGKIVVSPLGMSPAIWSLSASEDHWWGPIATECKVEVSLESPRLSWRGSAYWDYNEGAKPLNTPHCEFASWDWTRARFADGSSAVVYDVRDSNHIEVQPLVLLFNQTGQVVDGQPSGLALSYAALAPTGWRIKRRAPVDLGQCATVMHTLEDTPFYCRDVVSTVLHGQSVMAMHETLNVKRLASIVVQGMLPFKMPRTS